MLSSCASGTPQRFYSAIAPNSPQSCPQNLWVTRAPGFVDRSAIATGAVIRGLSECVNQSGVAVDARMIHTLPAEVRARERPQTLDGAAGLGQERREDLEHVGHVRPPVELDHDARRARIVIDARALSAASC